MRFHSEIHIRISFYASWNNTKVDTVCTQSILNIYYKNGCGFHPMGVSHTVVHYPYFPSTTIKGSPLPFPIVLEKGECFNTVLSTMNCGEVLRQYLHLLGNKRGKNRYIRPLLCLYFVGIYIHIFYIVIHTYMKHVRQ